MLADLGGVSSSRSLGTLSQPSERGSSQRDLVELFDHFVLSNSPNASDIQELFNYLDTRSAAALNGELYRYCDNKGGSPRKVLAAFRSAVERAGGAESEGRLRTISLVEWSVEQADYAQTMMATEDTRFAPQLQKVRELGRRVHATSQEAVAIGTIFGTAIGVLVGGIIAVHLKSTWARAFTLIVTPALGSQIFRKNGLLG